jgi:type III secretion protein N (ATPase)
MRELMAKYADVELLVKIGEYKAGSDKVADEAIAKIDIIRAFLKQSTKEHADMDETIAKLREITGV